MTTSDKIPDRVIAKILEYSQFGAVLILRQVNRKFRNFIDDPENLECLPDSKLYGIDLIARENSIELSVYSPEDSLTATYHKQENEKTSRTTGAHTVVIENSEFLNLVMIDLEKVLKFQKSSMNYFVIGMNFNPEHLEENSISKTLPIKLKALLESRKPEYIKTERLQISAFHEEQVMAILPFLDPEHLKRIHIAFNTVFLVHLEMSEIVETQQWKNAEFLYMRPQEFSADLKHLEHFLWSKVCFQSLSAEDLDFMKKMYCNSPKFEEFDAYTKKFDSIEKLNYIWGPPILQKNESHWYFKCSNSEEVMKIRCIFGEISFIILSRIKKDDVPPDVVVRE